MLSWWHCRCAACLDDWALGLCGCTVGLLSRQCPYPCHFHRRRCCLYQGSSLIVSLSYFWRLKNAWFFLFQPLLVVLVLYCIEECLVSREAISFWFWTRVGGCCISCMFHRDIHMNAWQKVGLQINELNIWLTVFAIIPCPAFLRCDSWVCVQWQEPAYILRNAFVVFGGQTVDERM